MTRYEEYITSNQGPKDLCEEIEQLKKTIDTERIHSTAVIEEQKETLKNREAFIDWVNEHYPEITKEYLGF